MSRTRTLVLGLVTALALGGVAALTLLSDGGDAPALDAGPTASRAVTTQTGGPTATGPTDAQVAVTLDLVDQTLAKWRTLHEPQGKLSMEETKALIAERDATAEALAEAIGSLSGEDIAAVLADWRTAEATRDKLVMIDGLGRNGNPEAVDALDSIYGEDGGFTNRSHVLRALGDSPADGHTGLLAEEMWGVEDERLSQLAAQALYGEEGAVQTLADAVTGDLPMNTRLEAIHSLGATGTDAARDALAGFASDPDLETRVQVYAEKELERSFAG